MRILFLTENFPPETNAAATRVFERACYWAKWGHEVTVVTCHPNFPEGKVYEGHANVWKTTEEMAGLKVIMVKTYIAANRGTARRWRISSRSSTPAGSPRRWRRSMT